MVVDPTSISIVVNDPNSGPPETHFNSIGHFEDGVTAPGVGLPVVNGGPAATYAGGIDVNEGVCLSTGRLTDGVVEPELGIGIEGPNNGDGLDARNVGEISGRMFSPFNVIDVGEDEDFVLAAFGHLPPIERPDGGDAAVLQFDVTTTMPGFLRISFVFGSDEAPDYLDEPFNDSFAMLIDGENLATITKQGDTIPFTLQDIEPCDKLYRKNDVAPEPNTLDDSPHGTPGASLYNVEFGGFTKRLTRETHVPLAPGTYTVKIVIQDVADRFVDSAIFVEAYSLKLFPLRQGDFNGDGIVDMGDYVIWSDNYNDPIEATFYHGDGNGNGQVDTNDYDLWRANYGQTGNRDWSCDFDRDGCVGFSDLVIFSQFYQNLPECASRFEGDATGDGAVTSADLLQLSEQFSESCGGEALIAGGEGEATLEALFGKMAKDSDALAELRDTWRKGVEQAERTAIVVLAPIAKLLIPPKADANEDGRVDADDFAIIDAVLGVKR